MEVRQTIPTLHLITVRSLHVYVRFDHRMPLPHQGVQLVPRERHAMEVRQTIPTLHLLDAQLDLLGRLVLVIVQISEVELQNAPFQLLRRDLGALGPRHQRFAALSLAEHAWRLDVVPLLLQKGVARLFLAALLATLSETLVLADRHGADRLVGGLLTALEP